MLYNDARPLIQSGDVLAFSHNQWGSLTSLQYQLVRIMTRSEYYHVGVAWPVAGRVMMLDAAVPRVRIFPLSHCLPFYWISLGKPMSLETEKYALSRVGESYSKLEAIRGLFGRTRDDEKWQCSEYVKTVLSLSGCTFSSTTTPSSIVRDLLAINNGTLIKVT